jgi:hypothetical protein
MASNIEVFAREVGHGGTRAAIALGKLLHGNDWKGKTRYDHEVSGVDADSFARRIHSLISTYEAVTAAYNTPFIFRAARKLQGSNLDRWAAIETAMRNPVVLCHESLAKALRWHGSSQPKILVTLNPELKPGESDIPGLDGIIVRSEKAKEGLLRKGYSPDEIYVGSIVDPDIVTNREEDATRRTERLNLCMNMSNSSHLRWLNHRIPEDAHFSARWLRPEYRGRFTVALITSGSGNYPHQIKEIIGSFHRPLSDGLVSLVLIGGYDHENAPMRVARTQAQKLGLEVHNTTHYNPKVEGFQVVHNTDTKQLVDSSIRLVRMADVAVLTSATDMMVTTEAATCPAYIGGYRGLHEKSDREHALREGMNYDLKDVSYDNIWSRICNDAFGLDVNRPTLLQAARMLYKSRDVASRASNYRVRSFINERIEAHSR